MVRECRPPAREPARSWLARRSTMATSTPASANSPANISPVGPAPAIATACSVTDCEGSTPPDSLRPPKAALEAGLRGLKAVRLAPLYDDALEGDADGSDSWPGVGST